MTSIFIVQEQPKRSGVGTDRMDNNNDMREQLKLHKVDLIQQHSKRFPDSLKNLPRKRSPYLLYIQGEKLDFKKCVAIVGTRNCSSKGDIIARELSGKLAKNGYLIVSGLARGIDRSAHIGAIDAGGKTIAVVAWLPEIYPADHNTLAEDIRKNGCIISEYFLVDEKSKGLIVRRNQIISALSDFVIVVETGPTGGANYAVEYAHKLSKTVIAIKPKSENTEFSEGFKKLVANGAIEADSASQAIKIIKKGIKQRKSSLDDF